MKHKHRFQLKEVKLVGSYEKVEGNKKLTKEQIEILIKHRQEYINFNEEIAVFICECGKLKEVKVKR